MNNAATKAKSSKDGFDVRAAEAEGTKLRENKSAISTVNVKFRIEILSVSNCSHNLAEEGDHLKVHFSLSQTNKETKIS